MFNSTMALRLKCELIGCDFIAENDDKDFVLAQFSSHQKNHDRPAVVATPSRLETRAPKMERPRVSSGCSEETWNTFMIRWRNYKRTSGISETARTGELFACCDIDIGDDLIKHDSTLLEGTEDNLLLALKKLAVIPVAMCVRRSELLQLRQDHSETARLYYSRFKGKADTCGFQVKCNQDGCPGGDNPEDYGRNIKMDEEKSPKDNTKDIEENQNEDIIDAPQGPSSECAPKHDIDKEEAFDIASDPGGKHSKVEEPLAYDSVDTPDVVNYLNGFPTLNEDGNRSSTGMILNTDATDFQGQDATDSAPPSAASPECEDGPFSGKLGSLKGKAIPIARSDIQDSPIEHANCYPMTTTPRGYFLLVNNKDFLPESTLEHCTRNGTDIDAAAMKALFEELGYIVDYYRNLTCLQIRKAVKKIATMDYRKVSAVACCFLSHGKEGILYGIDGEIEIRDLTSYFKDQRGLVGKPKMFFFQACQGSEYMNSIESDAGLMEVDGPADNYGNDISLPPEADFILAYSTVPGYYSFRNRVKGSWFIQGIVEVFRQYAHKMDVVRMLTRVNQIVSWKKSLKVVKRVSDNKRQISSIITQLRYELFLSPPHGPLKKYQPP